MKKLKHLSLLPCLKGMVGDGLEDKTATGRGIRNKTIEYDIPQGHPDFKNYIRRMKYRYKKDGIPVKVSVTPHGIFVYRKMDGKI